MRALLRLALAALAFLPCTAAAAQLPADSERATATHSFIAPRSPGNGSYLALGTHIRGPIDVQTPPNDTGCLGVEYAWGHYWVTGRAIATVTGPHHIYKYDHAGSLLATIVQGGSSGSPWGGRDIAVDEAGNKLWTGQESNRLDEYDFDPMTGLVAYTTSYTIAGGHPIIRGLARDPSNGHFFQVNLLAPLIEFTINPFAIVNTFPANGKSPYGLAWEYVNDRLWTFSQDGGTFPQTDAVEFNEIDPATGALTGKTFHGVVYGVSGFNIAGGCDIYEDPLLPGKLSIVGLHQHTPDQLNVYDLDVSVVCSGDTSTYCSAKVNSLGCTPVIGASGVPSASAGSGFQVTGWRVRNRKAGVLLYGLSGPDAVPFQGGTLCVASPALRTPPVKTFGSPPPANDCTGVFLIDFNAFASGALGGNPAPALSTPGTQVHCQWWGRDSGFAPPNGSTLTNGLSFTMCP